MSVNIRDFWNSCVSERVVARRPRLDSTRFSLEILESRVLLAASVLVSPPSNVFTTEGGGTTQFEVVLSKAPKGKSKPVEIPIQSSNPSEGTVDVDRLIFTSLNWSTPQVVTVTGVDDQVEDGDRSYKIELGKILTKARNYRRVDPHDVSLVNLDNDGSPPGVRFSPPGFVLNDASSRLVSVSLTSRPIADVVLNFEITKGLDQAQISTSTLTFTRENWNIAQQFTIGAFMDDRHDGDQPFEITVHTASLDSGYDNLSNQAFTATIHDINPLTISLDGVYVGIFEGETTVGAVQVPVSGSVEFSIADGVLIVSSPEGGQGTVTGDQIEFTTASGVIFNGTFFENSDGSVTASGTWQSLVNGVVTGSGTWAATDLFHVSYNLLIVKRVPAVVNEGATRDYYFSLTSPPSANVTISFEVTTGASQASLSKSSLVFTPTNWNTPQLVTLTAVADDGVDGDLAFEFVVSAQSVDANYANLQPVTLLATIHDTAVTTLDLDGLYTGTYTGNVTIFGISNPVNGAIEFTVDGSTVSVNLPAEATGTLDGLSVNFAPTSGPLSGAVFTGMFEDNGDGTITASGQWSISQLGTSGSGTWTATRAAPT